MSRRRRTRRPQPQRQPQADRGVPGGVGPERIEEHPDGDWVVRPISGAASTKAYRCPGCDQEIPPATPHVVVWPADGPAPRIEDRRHWHRPCWDARHRRRPIRSRAR